MRPAVAVVLQSLSHFQLGLEKTFIVEAIMNKVHHMFIISFHSRKWEENHVVPIL